MGKGSAISQNMCLQIVEQFQINAPQRIIAETLNI